MSRLTDAELSRAVQSRDEAAMEVIINRYSRLLWRVCAAVLSKSGGTQDVEECVADAFVYLWRYPERYDSSRSTLKTFLCMVARSRAMDRYRSLMRSRTVPMEEGLAAQTLDISVQALSAETRQELTAALHTLPEEEQDMLLRRYLGNQKPREIALALGITSRQVQNRLYRARSRLARTAEYGRIIKEKNDEQAEFAAYQAALLRADRGSLCACRRA